MKGMQFQKHHVELLLAGKKTQSRRLLKFTINDRTGEMALAVKRRGLQYVVEWSDETGFAPLRENNYHSVCAGERRYIRESYYFNGVVHYTADDASKLVSPLFMSEAYSRGYVVFTQEAIIQRLHQITAEDALAEGIEPCDDPVRAYFAVWDEIYGEVAPVARNPWVAVLNFTVEAK